MQKILEDTQQRLKFSACTFRGAQLLLNDWMASEMLAMGDSGRSRAMLM